MLVVCSYWVSMYVSITGSDFKEIICYLDFNYILASDDYAGFFLFMVKQYTPAQQYGSKIPCTY